MSRTLKFGFYQASASRNGESLPFGNILVETNLLPDDESRTAVYQMEAVRCQSLQQNATHWTGDFMRVRFDAEPLKGKSTGEIEKIMFDSDEGLCELTALLFDPVSRVVVLHEFRGGVTRNAIAHFLSRLTSSKVSLDPCLRPNALRRVQDMEQSIRRVRVKFATPHTAATTVGASASRLIEAASYFSAPEMDVQLTLGRARQTGRFRHAYDLVRDMVRWNDETGAVKKIEVEGEDGEDRTLIDLQSDRLVVERVVETDDRRISDAQRYRALRDAWGSQREYLAECYGG